MSAPLNLSPTESIPAPYIATMFPGAVRLDIVAGGKDVTATGAENSEFLLNHTVHIGRCAEWQHHLIVYAAVKYEFAAKIVF